MIELRPISTREYAEPLRSTENVDIEQRKRELLGLLVDRTHSDVASPPLADLASALCDLASGARAKVIVPIPSEPKELTLLRRGRDLLVSCYETGAWPEIVSLDRAVPLADVLDATIALLRAYAGAERHRDALSRGAIQKLLVELKDAKEELETSVVLAPALVEFASNTRAQTDETAFSFGFAAACYKGLDPLSEGSARADIHATLFDGRVWALVRGRRIPLARGPVFLVAQRMVSAMRALVDGFTAEKPVNVRLRAGSFFIGVRLERDGSVALTLGSGDDGPLTLPALDVHSAATPVLKFASELVRGLIAVDRSQTKNLRVLSLRDEVRALRRELRAREKRDGFTHQDPERLRIANPSRDEHESPSASMTMATPHGRLRFTERWRAEIEGLDATSTFLCGDRIVVATSRRLLAIHRDTGEALWMRRGPRAASMMVGTQLLRLSPDGVVELWDVGEGEVTARTRIAPRVGGAPICLYVGGGQLPPMAVLAEGTNRLVAIDLRTGEPVWRYRARGSSFRLKRAGRILLVISGENAIAALDAATGEPLWKHAGDSRFSLAPALCRDAVVSVSSEPGGGAGRAVSLDLYSGELLWQRDLEAAPLAAPVATDTSVCFAVGNSPRAVLANFKARTGELSWSIPDIGVGRNASVLTFDRSLIVNAPGGRISALDLDSGDTRWTRSLSEPTTDEVPRRLEPILRGGALFVPASSVHVLRPTDGQDLGAALDCELIPDVLRVDERGWLFVAEESGHLRAFAPAPMLTLVRKSDA